ncbi:MAG: apolipoprotein N-acyltransferase [Pyrinomonadaceae bacterium]
MSDLFRVGLPTRGEWGLAVLSALLLVFAFPDFDLWPLAWVALAPLVFAIVRRPRPYWSSFLLGWLFGTLFFYGSCWWLTHSMIHYGGIPSAVAFLLLFPVTLVVGLFPGLFALALARLAGRWQHKALLLAPCLWAAQEWARFGVTGQLWNAAGYSQAFHPTVIQTASFGGVYAVGFLIMTVNAAAVYALLRPRTTRTLLVAAATVSAVFMILFLSAREASHATAVDGHAEPAAAVIVGVQPNVEADFKRSVAENEALVSRHLSMSANALRDWDEANRPRLTDAAPGRADADGGTGAADVPASPLPRVVVWPESPMNFTYARDTSFRETVGEFARAHDAAVLFNALEPAPAGGAYNSAVLVDASGRLVAQYDKIRLLPFGEYVPLPRWLPGASLVTGIVGDFTPGADYKLMPFGAARGGVFICIESAYPEIARTFAREGADVLVNISNDGYLGRTPVLRQHLANTVFRAVENRRPVLRVTNTGISARVSARGEVSGATESFEPAVRTWLVARAPNGQTFYTRHGDLFVMLCTAVSALALLATVFTRAATRP